MPPPMTATLFRPEAASVFDVYEYICESKDACTTSTAVAVEMRSNATIKRGHIVPAESPLEIQVSRPRDLESTAMIEGRNCSQFRLIRLAQPRNSAVQL